jgi:peptide/nickel transport system substrate-binding protein
MQSIHCPARPGNPVSPSLWLLDRPVKPGDDSIVCAFNMDRRAFVKAFAAIAAGAGALAVGRLGAPAPARAQTAASRTLQLIPHAALADLDPISHADDIVRNAALLVWDTLYGVDRALKPQRQMVEAEEVSAQGRTWTFRLRAGLRFHDGEPVRARDAVASINRWAARDATGAIVKSIENELAAVDDRTFRWRLKIPFPRLLVALGKLSPPCCFVMPERIAATDAFQDIDDDVGSGPMRFVAADWEPGRRAAFERFADYVPREEPASWLAGGKRIAVDRIEWIMISDPTAAAAAIASGAADWWALVPPSHVTALRATRNMRVEISDPLGSIGLLVMNHLVAPFKDVRARRAVLMALSQQEFMRAYAGDDSLWRPQAGFFTPGTPLFNEEGGEVLAGPRRLDTAKALLKESGYAGAPATLMVAQDIASSKVWGGVAADLLTRLGMTVDYVATNRRDLAARLAQGAWHIYPTAVAGVDCIDPTNTSIRANGEVAANGWPDIPEIEEEVANWFDPDNTEQELAIARRLNRTALDQVVAAPLGFFLNHHAWRNTVSGITQGPAPFFWNVGKMD